MLSPHGKITCPRCGYDLQGTVSTWYESCPMNGTCSECGLHLEWGRVYMEGELPGIFEYNWKKKPFRSGLKTIWLSVRPWKLFKVQDLYQPIHLKPICLFTALLFFSILLIVFVNNTTGYWYLYSNVQRADLLEILIDAVEEMKISRYDIYLGILPVVACITVMPVSFNLIPLTLRKTKVRFLHLIRVTIYLVYSVEIVILVYTIGDLILCLLYYNDLLDIWDVYRWLPDIEIYPEDIPVVIGIVNAVIFGFWICIWWLFACKSYLKIPSGWLVSLLLTAITVLITGIIMVGVYNLLYLSNGRY